MVEHGGHLLVDPGLADVAVGHQPVGVAEDHGHQLRGVDPEIEQRSAAEGDVEQAVGRVDVPPEPEVGLDEARVADPLLAEQVTQHGVGGQEPAPHRLHEEQPTGAGVGHHGAALQAVEGERLLAQHGLAGGQVEAGVPLVGGVGRGDVHDVDVGVGGEVLAGAVRRGMPCRSAKDAARSAEREATATTSASSSCASPVANVSAMCPVEEMPQRMGSVTTRSLRPRRSSPGNRRGRLVSGHMSSLVSVDEAAAGRDAPRRRLSPRQAATVARLSEALLAELATVGYDGLTVRSVARRAGVAPATAYTYFTSKAHLVAEVFWRRLRALPDPRVDAAAPAHERVAAALRALADHVAAEPALAAASTPALLGPDPDVHHLRDRIGAEVHRRVAAALATGGPASRRRGPHRPPRRRRPGRPGRRRRPHAGRRAAAGRHGPHGLRRSRRPARRPLTSRDRRPPMTERSEVREAGTAPSAPAGTCGSAPTTTPSTRTPTPPTPACATRRRCSTTPTRTSGRCRGTPT